jgi:hypothetical protein
MGCQALSADVVFMQLTSRAASANTTSAASPGADALNTTFMRLWRCARVKRAVVAKPATRYSIACSHVFCDSFIASVAPPRDLMLGVPGALPVGFVAWRTRVCPPTTASEGIGAGGPQRRRHGLEDCTSRPAVVYFTWNWCVASMGSLTQTFGSGFCDMESLATTA